jgi:hypothetical protein
MSYQYTLDTQKIEILEADGEGHYEVLWENLPVGYIYVSEINDDTGEPIWNGSTPLLNLHAPQIGEYIESVDM